MGASRQRHPRPASRRATRSGSRTRGRAAGERADGVAADPAVGCHVARAVEPGAAGQVDGGGQVVHVEELGGRLLVGDGERAGASEGPGEPAVAVGRRR